jgi:hypothetical protein
MVEYDRSLFFAELRDFAGALATLLARLPKLRRAHAMGMEEMGTAAFWREVYGLPLEQADGTPRAANDGKAAAGAHDAWPAKAA